MEWRGTGQLPTARGELRAAVVDKVLYVTGGLQTLHGSNSLTSILSWNPSTKTWQQAGELKMGAAGHAAVAVPSSNLSFKCSAML